MSYLQNHAHAFSAGFSLPFNGILPAILRCMNAANLASLSLDAANLAKRNATSFAAYLAADRAARAAFAAVLTAPVSR